MNINNIIIIDNILFLTIKRSKKKLYTIFEYISLYIKRGLFIDKYINEIRWLKIIWLINIKKWKKIIYLLKIIKIGINIWEGVVDNITPSINDNNNNNNYNRYIPPHFRWYLMMRLTRSLLPILQYCGMMDLNPTQVLAEDPSYNQLIFWSIYLVTAVIMFYLDEKDKQKEQKEEEEEEDNEEGD